MKMLQRAEAKKAVIRYGGLLLGTAILSFGLYCWDGRFWEGLF